MTFEELVVRDKPQLPTDHPFYYLESELKEKLLPKKHIHDAEHDKMLLKWGCKVEHTSKLTIKIDDAGIAYADRMYHILLHLRFWKDEGEHMDYVNRFEQESGLNLDEVELPKPSSKGESVY
jgi:hypothetical protein